MIAFSPGLAQGCFELLAIASRNALTFSQVQPSFARLGSLSSGRVIETSQALRWVRTGEDNNVTLTATGARVLALSGYQPMLRQALLDYIEVERPPWIQNAAYGRARVLSFAGSEIAQVFVEAGLAHGVEDDVVAFWDSLAAIARGQKNDRLLAIGRKGEQLTLAYEHARTGHKPRWVAIDSNEDGYDVLSIIDANDAQQLSIEVKASTMGMAGRFYLSRNEWERASEAQSHCFHLWDMQNAAEPTLARVSQQEMRDHIPSDCGFGTWASVEIPFATFCGRFAPMALTTGAAA